MDDVSKTGINQECAWHSLIGFHATLNYAVDVMHDLLEGVCNYDLSFVVSHLIALNLFSLESLNSMIQGFSFSVKTRYLLE